MSKHDLLLERSREFGPVGEVLLGAIRANPYAETYTGQSFVRAIVRLHDESTTLNRLDPLLPYAISLLSLDFPVQVRVDSSFFPLVIRRLAMVPFDFIRNPQKHLKTEKHDKKACAPTARRARAYFTRLTRDKNLRDGCFPHKPHRAAYTKPNVALGPLIRSFGACVGSARAGQFLYTLSGRVTHDVVMMAMIYAFGLIPHYGARSLDIAAWLVLRPDIAKGLSTALKTLGANSQPAGTVLCEGGVLQGRAASDLDLEEEKNYRCDPRLVTEQVIDPGEELRQHIEAVVDNELRGTKLELPPLEDWWSKRWLWCVNGSQNKDSSRALGVDESRLRQYHSRLYRRMASEAVEAEPITTWDGTTYISGSPKLESGKTRAIFACDTRSYFAFEWISSVLQKAWRNDRVLLDPGEGGHLGMAQRVRNFMRHGGVNLMLDYDDFNSQHSLRSQEILTEVLCARVNAPDWYTQVLCGSWYKMFVKTKEGPKRWLGTLPSGHRWTTIVNSVLNAAYIRMAIGAHLYERLLSLHTGDDVYMRVDTLDLCKDILHAVRAQGCRLNPAKQSVGYNSAEFLRVVITNYGARGYLARGVASFVSGNWTGDNPLDPAEALRTAILGCRTLINRSDQGGYDRLLGPALRQHQPLPNRHIIDILGGRAVLDASPVYNTAGPVKVFESMGHPEDRLPIHPRWPRNATKTYLANHVTPVEMDAIAIAGTDVNRVMTASSYTKGHSSLPDLRGVGYRIRRRPNKYFHGIEDASELVRRPADRGVLRGLPIVHLLRSRLTTSDIQYLLHSAGYAADVPDPFAYAFGEDTQPVNVVGTLSYADASSLAKRTRAGNILAFRPTHV